VSDPEKTRKAVSESYAAAVARPSGGCCGGAPKRGCCGVEQKGASARMGGYAEEQLATLPEDAVVNSFGCGNPVAFSEIGEGETVLDLGCGAGIDLLLAARKVGPRGKVVGVDMTDEMLAKARQNLRAAGVENAELRAGIIERLPVASESVDWVISNCVINLSPEKQRIFSEIARVLKPGGRMLISDIVAEELPEEVRADPGFYSACIAGAVSEREYVLGLQMAGMEDIEVRERLIYDAAQLEEMFGADGLGGCCGSSAESHGCGAGRAGTMRDLAKRLEGKIWSARVFARKPL
jgi:arsenite methyltransferase